MEASARVHEVDTNRAVLACAAPAAGCGRCAGRVGCALQRLSGGRSAVLEVPRRAADGQLLAVGTRVTIEVSEGDLLRASARAYLPPLAGVLAGPALAERLSAGGDAWMLLGAATGLFVGWVGARIWLRHVPPAVAVRVTAGDEPEG